ncbi:MAG: hypothetical protein ICV83_25580 [Cytophagales bacterium]|nr:hypothetical protein [Cytophagales bacterium]
MTSSDYREKLRQKRQILETCLAHKVRLYGQFRQARQQSVADLADPALPDAQIPSEAMREALFAELINGSVQLDALGREIALLESLRKEDRLYRQVQLGAVVKTDGSNFLVAVNQTPFRVAGEEYVCVSPQSPFLRFAQGLIRGDSFTVANRNYLIREVF